MQRPQKTAQAGCPCEGMLETESNRGACSIALTETERRDGAEDLLERILDRNNLNKAYLKVKRNGGSAGVDGMTVEEMLPYLKEHRGELLNALKSGRYKPQAVRRVEIPKPDGGVRKLGVPTVVDRMIQQAIVQVLQPMYEPLFSDSSYGFRPKRSAHQAISKALEYYEQGYRYVVDLDLAKYFDTVNHAILIGMLREQIKDERVVQLIRKYLRNGVMEHGLISPTREGTPQGGNLSPLLSNIYLTAFDRLLESRGHKFVRYADGKSNGKLREILGGYTETESQPNEKSGRLTDQTEISGIFIVQNRTKGRNTPTSKEYQAIQGQNPRTDEPQTGKVGGDDTQTLKALHNRLAWLLFHSRYGEPHQAT